MATKQNRGSVAMFLRRDASGMTRNELALSLGLHASEISVIEAGRRIPGRRLALDIEHRLKIDPSWWDEAPPAADAAKADKRRAAESVRRGIKVE